MNITRKQEGKYDTLLKARGFGHTKLLKETKSKEQKEREEIMGAVARGYTHERNKDKVIDVDLCKAITEEVSKLLKEKENGN